jgi:hypothetical protein
MKIRKHLFHIPLLVAALGLAAVPARAAMALSPRVKKGSSPSEEPAPTASPTPSSAPEEGGASAGSAASAPATATPAQPQAPRKIERAGVVIYVGGAGIVGEIKGGAKAKERFRVYDSGSRLRGEAVAVKALDEATFVLEPIGGAPVAVGNRLVRVGE